VAYVEQREIIGEALYLFLESLDVDGKGHLTRADLKENAELVQLHKQAGFLTPDGQFDYTKMRASIRDTVKQWDLKGDGGVSLDDIAAASKHHEALQKSNKRYHVILPLLGVGLILSCAMTFIMSFAAAEMAKEIETGNNGVVLTTDGSPARIASADMTVNPDGTLVAQSDASGRLSDDSNASSMPLATRAAETSRPLSSTIPDKLFDQMSKLTINGVDGVSHMTMTILGFTRVLTPSLCGSLVYIDTKHGTAVLDDTILHFDESLSQRALALGIELEGTSAHGRRLASGAEVAGIFSFFADYDWQCDSIPVPESPAAPYIITTVKRVSCPAKSQCSSYMGEGIMYPGYEANTDSVIVAETLVETKDFFLSIQKYPNHPLQSLVTLTDHKHKSSRTMQILNGTAHHCMARKYADAVANSTDTLSSYFPAYLGHEMRAAEEFDMPWGRVSIPQKNVRAFRLQPRPDIDGALPVPIDYDDDATTLLPTRLLFNGADQMNLDVKEILVEKLQQDAEAAALELRKGVDFACDDDHIDHVPVMQSAVTEEKEDVDFYTKYYSGDSNALDITNSYWIKAMEEEDAENLRLEIGGRRLLNKRLPRNLMMLKWTGGFEAEFSGGKALISFAMWPWNLKATGQCTFASTPLTKWDIAGTLSVVESFHNYKQTFQVAGEVAVIFWFGAGISYTIKLGVWEQKINAGCGISISGYVGGMTGIFWYDCGRRLGSAAEHWVGEDSPEAGAMATHIGVNHTLEAKPEAEANADEEEERKLSEEDSSAPERRLFARRRRRSRRRRNRRRRSRRRRNRRRRSRRRRRRSRRRRRRVCPMPGFLLLAGIRVGGGCSVGRRRLAGVDLGGSLDITLGPWPSPPLDARAKASVKAKACIKIGPFKGCLSMGKITFFDKKIPRPPRPNHPPYY